MGLALRFMRNQAVLSTRDHMTLTAEGLLNASRHSPDGGYAMSYSLYLGWASGYVETTGYIIPTALDLADALGRADLRQDALKHGPWLLRHQLGDGSFPDASRAKAEVFDTGQVLMGLHRLHAETGEERYAAAAVRAATWLAAQFAADRDESERTGRRLPTYVTRSASALIDFGTACGRADHVEAGRDFLARVEPQMLPNGLYANSQLAGDTTYLLHTIVYVLEGFLHAYAVLGERRWLDAALKGAEPLKKANLEREVILYSRYDADLNPCTSEKCVVGLSQWAGLCLQLYDATSDEGYRECASNSLYFVKSKQIQSQGQLNGALPGSVPFWGQYLKMAFPNWNLKFFGDALLKWHRFALDDGSHQEVFVGRSHAIYAGTVGWTAHAEAMNDFDIRVLDLIGTALDQDGRGNANGLDILDLGCGEGRFMRRLQNLKPAWRVRGVDPIQPRNTNLPITRGTARQIPFSDESLDGIYATVALQHVDDVDGCLSEINRVLRPSGVFVVFDRNPISLRGLMKPWHEIRGRWLYSWDAPFREQWHTLAQWKHRFRRAGFRIIDARSMTHLTKQELRGHLPINRFLLVAGQKF